MREAAADAGFRFDDRAGLGDCGGRFGAEVRFESRGMLAEHAGATAVIPGLDGVELAPSVVGEAALHGGSGQPAELRDVGLGKSVGRESQNFHPLLNLRAGMVKAVAVELFEFGRRQVEQSHGILPRGDSKGRKPRESVRDVKLSLNCEGYSGGFSPGVVESLAGIGSRTSAVATWRSQTAAGR